MHHKLPKDISLILDCARFSPSSHNTQPWTVKQSHDNTLVIGYDPARHLTVGDPLKRELFVSLGCFVETLSVASLGYGYKAAPEFLGDSADRVMRVTFRKAKSTPDRKGLDFIRRRRSDRRYYQEKSIPDKNLRKLQDIVQGAASIAVLTDRKDIDFLADMTAKATFEVMSNPDFREELSNWVRNNWTKQPDGMPGYTQGIPGPVSLLAKLVIRKNKKMAKTQAKQDSQRVAHSVAVGLVCVTADTPSAWVDAGRVYQRTCLAATRHDIKTAGVSAALVVENTAKKIVETLDIPGTPVALIRFGYTESVPKASPRLKSSDFVIAS